MSWDDLLAYCLAKPGAWRDEPWGDGVVTKVGPKIFAFLGTGTPPAVGIKCGANRETADEWLHRYPDDVTVMAYIGRSGWNNLLIGGAIPDDEVLEAIDASYVAVVSKLPKKDRPLPPPPRTSGRRGFSRVPGRTVETRRRRTTASCHYLASRPAQAAERCRRVGHTGHMAGRSSRDSRKVTPPSASLASRRRQVPDQPGSTS